MAAIRVPKRLEPPAELVDRWREVAERRGADVDEVDEYVDRWKATWMRVLRTCLKQGSWDDRDLDVLLELIEWRRLAHDHQAEAEQNPYKVHPESGRVFAHPGFDKARDARREARELSAELLLTPEARRIAGLEDEDEDGPSGDQAGL